MGHTVRKKLGVESKTWARKRVQDLERRFLRSSDSEGSLGDGGAPRKADLKR